jgi:acyl-CoA thioesterase
MHIDLNKIRNFFADDRFAAMAGAVIESASEDAVECAMAVGDSHLNAGGVVQGGAIFTLADFAFAVACNLEMACGADVGITVGQSCSISFLKSPRGKLLKARAEPLSKGRTVKVFQVRVTDEAGTLVAVMTGNGFQTRA